MGRTRQSRRWATAYGGVVCLVAGLGSVQSVFAAARVSNVELREAGGIRPTAGETDLIGLLAGDPGTAIKAPRLYIYGLRPGDHAICIQIERLNGAYRAFIAADVSGADGSKAPVQIDYASVYSAQFVGRPALEVSVRAKASANRSTCEQAGELVVASWQPTIGDKVHALFLNTEGFATLRVPGGVSPCKNVNKVAPVTGQETGYDSVCTLSVPTTCPKLAEIVIDRRDDYGGRLKGIDTPFRPPC